MGKIRGKWTEENMKAAIQSVLKGEQSIRESSQRYCVPKSSLADRVNNLKRGQETLLKPNTANKGTFHRTFNEEQERMLYEHCKKLDEQLMPLNRTEFMKLAYQFAEVLKVDHRFNKSVKMAGKAFYYDFMNKYKDLSLRTAQSTSLQRAVGFNKEQVSRFFDKLTELMTKHTFPPSRIFNADETGVSVVHTNRLKVISSKGKKQVGKLTTAERGRNVTILLCINAAGDQFIPPLFVLPRQRIDAELKKDAPLGSIFDGQPNGWITKDGFLKWLTLFQERVTSNEKSPVLLIVDGHGSHKDLDVIVFAKKHHIHMISLPPHTSHKLQPLDRAIMKPFKNAYNEACSLWMRRYPLMKIALKDIAGLVNEAFSKISRMELAKSGFACTGISPINPNIFTDLDFKASLISQMDTDSQPENDFRPETSKSLCQLEQTSFLDLNVPGTSTKSSNVLEEISPLPSSSNSKFPIRKGRSEKSEILTSTPFKSQIEARRALLEEKKVQAEERKRKREEKALLKNKNNKGKLRLMSAKRTLKFDGVSKNGNSGNDTNCIICAENFNEDWIQCSTCKGWAHENCADLEGSDLFYICDSCKNKK